MVHRCFRILGIPASWTEDEVLTLLKKSTGYGRSSGDKLNLYPCVDDSDSQVGILAFVRSKDYIDTFVPNDHDNYKKTICQDNNITIDQFFYGMTPLNTPDTPMVEYVFLEKKKLRLRA